MADQIVFSNNYMVYLICLLPSIISYITLTTCYKTAFAYNRFPEWVVVPWISFTGVNQPESDVFACGLTVAGLCLIFVNHIFATKLMNDKRVIDINHLNFHLNDYIHPNYKYYVNTIIKWILSYFLIIASIAVTIQAWINVDNEMVLTFCSPEMQNMQWYPSYNAVIHIGCAAVFFFEFIFLHNVAVVLTFNYRNNQLLQYSFYYKVLILSLGLIFGLLCVGNVFYVSYIVDPIRSQKMFRFGLNGIGFCQYITTICDCLFWISFGFDYYVIAKTSSKKEA